MHDAPCNCMEVVLLHGTALGFCWGDFLLGVTGASGGVGSVLGGWHFHCGFGEAKRTFSPSPRTCFLQTWLAPGRQIRHTCKQPPSSSVGERGRSERVNEGNTTSFCELPTLETAAFVQCGKCVFASRHM